MPIGTGGGGGSSARDVRAGGAYVEVGVRSTVDKGLAAIKAKVAGVGKFIGKALAATGVGVGGAGASVLGPLAAAFTGAVDRGKDFRRLAERLGGTTEELSGLAYVAQTTGQSLEDLEGHYENLAERIEQGKVGAGEAVETFRTLGVDANKLSLMGPVQQMEALADAINAVSNNDTVRRGLLSTLGGDKFQGLNELFKKGSAGIQALRKEAADVGAVVGTEEAKQADRAWQALNRVWAAAKNTVVSLGAALLPQVGTLEELTGRVVGAARTAREWVAENQGVVAAVGAAAAALVAGGTALTAFGGAAALAGPAVGLVLAPVGLLASVIGGVATVTAAAVGPVGLLAAGLATLGYYFLTREHVQVAGAFGSSIIAAGESGAKAVGTLIEAVQNLTSAAFGALINTIKRVWDTARETFGGVKDTFVATWGGIVGAVKAGDLKSALDIAFKGIDLGWKQLVLGMKKVWLEFVEGLKNIDLVVKDAVELATARLPDKRAAVQRGALFARQFLSLPSFLAPDEEAEQQKIGEAIQREFEARNQQLVDNLKIEQAGRRKEAENAAQGRADAAIAADPLSAAIAASKKALDDALTGAGKAGDEAEAATSAIEKFFAEFNKLAPKVGGNAGPGFFGQWIEDGLRKINISPAAITDAAKGTFGGPLAQQLGGVAPLSKQQLETQKQILKAASNTAGGVDDLNRWLRQAMTIQ